MYRPSTCIHGPFLDEGMPPSHHIRISCHFGAAKNDETVAAEVGTYIHELLDKKTAISILDRDASGASYSAAWSRARLREDHVLRRPRGDSRGERGGDQMKIGRP